MVGFWEIFPKLVWLWYAVRYSCPRAKVELVTVHKQDGSVVYPLREHEWIIPLTRFQSATDQH